LLPAWDRLVRGDGAAGLDLSLLGAVLEPGFGQDVIMRQYGLVQPAIGQVDVAALAARMFALMLRNVASDGFVFTDPADPARFSVPGCIIASPSYDKNLATVTQDYVFNWTRDAAIAAVEIAAAGTPLSTGGSGPLEDYVRFADACQQAAPDLLTRAAWTIEATPRDWSDQNDGPALQTIAVLAAYDQLDTSVQPLAVKVADADVSFLLAGDRYRRPSRNLWEEVDGQSFFTTAVQLQCLRQVQANTAGLAVPAGVGAAIAYLEPELQRHWDGDRYVSVLDSTNLRPGYDPNIDIVCACIYGAVPATDPKLLATAAQLHDQWAASSTAYPINIADAAAGMGPLMGRYPGDTYDGDTGGSATDHPWALCTANFAQLYYQVAAAIEQSGQLPSDPLCGPFLAQAGVGQASGTRGGTAPADAWPLLRAAGDRMLRAIVYHSDHLELSEQFDGITGYEKSVRNLTWSYAAYLSAVRARSVLPPA
jgi:glucoamylase